MKHLLNGVAVAAALAIAAPAWAQMNTPMSPSAPAAPPAASTEAPAEPMATSRHHRARPHRMARHGRTAKSSSDNSTTEQLNRQELSRIQTGPAPMAAPAPMPMQQGGPRPSGGTGRGM
jgi:hypothetical protein